MLDATTAASSKVCVPIAKANDKRNKLTYDGLTTFSRAELEELIRCVEVLEKVVLDDLSKTRADLLKP